MEFAQSAILTVKKTKSYETNGTLRYVFSTVALQLCTVRRKDSLYKFFAFLNLSKQNLQIKQRKKMK